QRALRGRAARAAAGRRGAGVARVRQPDRGRGVARGGDGARSRLRRRDRRHPLGQARRPDRTAYGLDMTDELLALARRNAAEAGVANVHFLKGVIEEIPLPAESVDVVISNCVINLSVDTPAVLTEIARVLKPGGRIGISDVVAEDRLSPAERAGRGSYVGCIAGALSRGEYEAGLEAAGFEEVSVEFTHEVADGVHGAIVQAVEAREPVRKGLPLIKPATTAGCC